MFRAGRCCQCLRTLVPPAQNSAGIALRLVTDFPPTSLSFLLLRTLTQWSKKGVSSTQAYSSCLLSLIRCRNVGSHPTLSCLPCDIRVFISRLSSTATKLTHYEVLGLERDASADEVRAAFLQKSKECHPDINSKNPNNHKQFVLVNEAYSVLSRPLSRRDYDISLSRQRAHSHNMTDNSPYYHHPRGFYDKHAYSNQDRSSDGSYKQRPYYGIPGLEKVSNSKIVLVCVIWMLIGILVHFLAVRKSSELHTKLLDERDAKAHEMWLNAKKSAEKYASASGKHHKRDSSVREPE